MAFKTAAWFTEQEIESLEPEPSISAMEWKATKKAEAARQREQIKFRLRDEGEHDFANKLEGCGLPMPLVCTHCGERKIAETQCRQRWCPVCAWAISQKRLKRFAGAVEAMEWPSMVTLTRANSNDPETVREFRQQWGKMRRRKIIADKIKGGVVGIEVTNIGNGWHPHLHAVIDCRWLAIHTPEPKPWDSPEVIKEKCEHAQGELAWLWGSVCGQQNSHVWVRRCHDAAGLAYSLKYSTKGNELVECRETLGPLLRVLQKTRLVSAFGSLYGRTAELDRDERPVMVCECCGTETSLCPAAVIYSIARIEPEKRLPSLPRNYLKT